MNTTKNLSALAQRIGIPTALAIVLLASSGVAYADTLTRSLDIGMSGSDVSTLQAYLATDSTIYPEALVTGYFGTLTSAAVGRFQCRNNIVCSGSRATTGYGRVGPLTLAALQAKMNGSTGDAWAPAISNIAVSTGLTGATVTWNTNETARATVHYSTTPLPMTEASASVAATVGGQIVNDSGYSSSHSLSLSALQPNTLYYYVIESNDASGNVQFTWPSTFHTTN